MNINVQQRRLIMSLSAMQAIGRRSPKWQPLPRIFYPAHKAPNMKANLRNLWSRLPLTRADVQMLHGILRQMVRWKERG